MDLHGAGRLVSGGLGEGDKDEIPLGRNLAQGECASPVADELMPIGWFVARDCRDCGLGRWRDGSDRRAGLRRRSKRLRVRKAVRLVETFRCADIPGEQGYVLQMVCDSADRSKEGL